MFPWTTPPTTWPSTSPPTTTASTWPPTPPSATTSSRPPFAWPTTPTPSHPHIQHLIQDIHLTHITSQSAQPPRRQPPRTLLNIFLDNHLHYTLHGLLRHLCQLPQARHHHQLSRPSPPRLIRCHTTFSHLYLRPRVPRLQVSQPLHNL